MQPLAGGATVAHVPTGGVQGVLGTNIEVTQQPGGQQWKTKLYIPVLFPAAGLNTPRRHTTCCYQHVGNQALLRRSAGVCSLQVQYVALQVLHT